MAEIFIGLVKQMLFFLIVGQTILHFGMGKQYGKYIKLVISLMVAANLISAFFSLWRQSPDSFYDEGTKHAAASFEERWERNMENFQAQLNEKQSRMEEKWKEAESQQTSDEEVKSGYNHIVVEEIIIE